VFQLDVQGKERPVPGSFFLVDKSLVRFIPASFIRGSVYHLRAFGPTTGKSIGDFRFQAIPEVAINPSFATEGLRIELNWPELKDLMPSGDSQVVQLDWVELRISASGARLLSFPLTAKLPPFGSSDGVGFQAQPFRFSMMVPTGICPPDGEQIIISLHARIIDIPQPLEVARTTLTTNFGSAIQDSALKDAPAGTDPDDSRQPPMIPPSASTPAYVPTENRYPTDDVGRSPGGSASTPAFIPREEPIVLDPVVPIADPGPRATVQKAGTIKVGEGNSNDYMSWPKGISWAQDGSLWVADSQNRRVLHFTEKGRLIKAFGKKGKGIGMLGLPMDLVIEKNQVFVSDTSAHCIHVFSVDGQPIRDIGTWGTRTGQIDLPHGMFAGNDQVVVADRGNCRIVRFGLEGTGRGGFGSKGELPGFLNYPICVQANRGEVLVLEEGGRLQRFSPDGKFLGRFPILLKEPGAFEVDPWGYIWIADSEANQVVRLDASGTHLLTLESGGTAKPWIPTSIAVRDDGLIAIGDGQSKTIRLFHLVKP